MFEYTLQPIFSHSEAYINAQVRKLHPLRFEHWEDRNYIGNKLHKLTNIRLMLWEAPPRDMNFNLIVDGWRLILFPLALFLDLPK